MVLEAGLVDVAAELDLEHGVARHLALAVDRQREGHHRRPPGRGGGGGVGSGLASTAAASPGALLSVMSTASSVTTRLATRTRPITCSHLPVSRFRLASRLQPAPLGFFPVTQTANISSLMTQSDERARLDEGRSPNRFSPRNCPRTLTVLPSNLSGRVMSSSSVVSGAATPFFFSS